MSVKVWNTLTGRWEDQTLPSMDTSTTLLKGWNPRTEEWEYMTRAEWNDLLRETIPDREERHVSLNLIERINSDHNMSRKHKGKTKTHTMYHQTSTVYPTRFLVNDKWAIGTEGTDTFFSDDKDYMFVLGDSVYVRHNDHEFRLTDEVVTLLNDKRQPQLKVYPAAIIRMYTPKTTEPAKTGKP